MYNKSTKTLITSGGTAEKIDSVCSITNHAIRSLGKYIAEIFLENEHKMTLAATKGAVKPQKQPHSVTCTVSNANNLVETSGPSVKTHDVFIRSMAVSDYILIYTTDLDEAGNAKHISGLLTQ